MVRVPVVPSVYESFVHKALPAPACSFHFLILFPNFDFFERIVFFASLRRLLPLFLYAEPHHLVLCVFRLTIHVEQQVK